MDNFKIVPVGGKYQVVEEQPDGRTCRAKGFPAEDDARGWLDSLLVLLGLIDCMSGRTTLH
jgi:hypothetical protein